MYERLSKELIKNSEIQLNCCLFKELNVLFSKRLFFDSIAFGVFLIIFYPIPYCF